MNLLKQDKEYILNLYNRLDIEIERGHGVYLYDKDGNKYLDMYSGISVNNLGHLGDELAQIIYEQAKKYTHLSNYFANEPSVNLAKLLVENTFASKVFFTNSGTEANEAAIKLVRKYGKNKSKTKNIILTAKNSFHGRTCGSLSLTARDRYKTDFLPLLPRVENFEYNNLESLKSLVNEDVCGLFIETIQGEGGIIKASNEFMKLIMQLSQEHDFLVVIDDIQAGIGRTGEFLSCDEYAVKPHIVTLAKSIGGGLPLGAMLVSSEVENILKPGDHGSTFGGNPVSCTAGEYIVRNIADKEFLASIKMKGNKIINAFKDMKSDYPDIIKDIRGSGLMIGIDVGKYAHDIKERAKKKNLLINITNDTVIRLLPSLKIEDNDINVFLNIIRNIMNEIKDH
ncbi:acetylornithine/succinylornithine family transaminase [Clostridiaceae bacterium M8S5]|nr:acetylornithine/succinylornithine family transaminase [Clostridiaceae bacterium M8S5]